MASARQPLAVAHLFDVFPAFILHFSFHLRGWWGNVSKLVLRNKRDNVEGIHTHLTNFFCNLRDVIFVDPGI